MQKYYDNLEIKFFIDKEINKHKILEQDKILNCIIILLTSFILFLLLNKKKTYLQKNEMILLKLKKKFYNS